MVSKTKHLLRFIFLGACRESSPDDKRHESNLVWGPIGIGSSIVLTVIAAMKHDLRFLFWMAWPCFVFGVWHLSQRISYKNLSIWATAGAAVVVAIGLHGLGNWLSPSANEKSPASPPTQTREPSIAVPNPPAPSRKKEVKPFPEKPLELLMFSLSSGLVIKNNSDETLFVSALTTSSMFSGNENSMGFPIGKEIKPHEEQSGNISGLSGTWGTLFPYSSGDWETAGQSAYQQYRQCVRSFAFLPDSPEFKQMVNHYRATNTPLPIGDAKGIISYRRGSDSKEEVIQLKALLFLQQGCSPQ